MTQEADADGHQCPQQTPTDTHRSRPFLRGICPRLSMCRMDQSVLWACKVCSAGPGGHMGHPATSQSIVIISALATPAHPSNPTPHVCIVPTVSRKTLLPHSKPLGLPASSSLWVSQHLPLLQHPSHPRALVVLLLFWPTQLQPNPVFSWPKAPYDPGRQKAGVEMFHQARRMSMWLKKVPSGRSAPGPQGDLGDLLPMTLSYVMALLRQ